MQVLIQNIDKIYTPDAQLPWGELKEYEHADILINDGLIADISESRLSLKQVDQVIDGRNKTLLPGFVDAHTHPVFWKTREDEFIMRTQGKTYEEIAAAGGGIRNSVRKFREASKEDIKSVSRERLKLFPEYGTTTIEAKSGYGLSLEDEVKSLEIINELNAELPLDLIPTFLGAHEIPDEYQKDRRAYIELVKSKMIPVVAEKKLALYCDVFCENGVFTVDESREILEAAQKYNFKIRIHADELSAFGGAELSGEMKAVTADHLVRASNEGILAMAQAGVIPVLLPGTTFFLGKDHYAPARKMIDYGCEIAVATDFNPGSSTTQNIQLMWTIGALRLKLTSAELLWATTLTPAKSLDLDKKIGSVEVGKNADLILLDIPNLNYLAYHYGINHTLITIKNGEIIYQRM